MDYYWQRVLEEVKHRNNPGFEKYFVHFSKEKTAVKYVVGKTNAYNDNRKNPKRYYLGLSFPGQYLTAREFDCAYWFLKGYGYPSIAKKLKLSVRTVESHFTNIRTKLDCHVRSQLFEVLLEHSDLGPMLQNHPVGGNDVQ